MFLEGTMDFIIIIIINVIWGKSRLLRDEYKTHKYVYTVLAECTNLNVKPVGSASNQWL
jgi:hypothetical protein